MMLNSIKQKAIVGQNGRIELPTTELTEGTVVEVIVLVEADPEEDETDYLLRSRANKQQLLDALENVKNAKVIAVDLDEYEKNYL
jgi:antitoxin YefM